MKHRIIFMILIIVVSTVWNPLISSQNSTTNSLNWKSIQKTTYEENIYDTNYSEFCSYDYGIQSGTVTVYGDNYDVTYEQVSYMDIDFSDLPNDAYNISAKMSIYKSSGSNGAEVILLADNTSSNNPTAFAAVVASGTILFDVDASSQGFNHDITSYVTSRLSGGHLKLGVRRTGSEEGQITVSVLLEWDAPSHITAKNIFDGGSIMVGVNSSPSTKSSPYNFTANVGATVNLRAVEQTHDGYYKLWNDTEAPSNKSNWTKQTGSGETNKSNTISYSFTAATDDDGANYVANLRKRCNITFKNEHIGGITGGTIKVNGTNYNSPTSSFPIVELNDITGGANWHAINGIEYTFDYWSDGGGSAVSHTFNPSIHKDYKAYFVGRPLNSYGSYTRSLQFNSGDPVGTPIELTWNQHPNSNVSEYRIYRKTKYGAETKIKTVTRTTASSYTYTDGLYSITNNTSTDNLLSYDVRAYYSTEGTVSDYDWLSIYGEILFKQNEEDLEENTFTEVLEYGISNYPNPFNPTTTIHYQLPEDANVSIKVFDILGKQIVELVNGEKGIGKHNVMFNSNNLSAGLYFYIIEAKPTNLNGKGFSKTNKMLLVK